MKKYTEAEVNDKLQDLEGWHFHEDAIHTSFEFENFKEAFSAMTRIAFEAESMNHHPEWTNVYGDLEIFLSTHDAGGVTDKDFELAKVIEELIGQ